MTRKKKRKWGKLIPYLFIAPNFIGFVIFILIPVIYSLIVSFTDFNIFKGFGASKFVGLKNYINMFLDANFLQALKNNLLYAAVTITSMMGLALFIAPLLNKKVYCSKLLRAMFFLPYITSIVAIAAIWKMIFNPSQGVLNQILRGIGFTQVPGWIGDLKWAMPSIMIVGTWIGLGYNVVVYMSGLQGIPLELYESARIDGASNAQVFRYITVPLLQSTTFFLLITNTINSFQVFGTVNIMTGGGPGNATSVLAHYMYVNGFKYNKMGYASAQGWFLLLMIFAITLFQWKIQKKYEESM